MEFINHEAIASVSLFKLIVSESELMAFEACIKYVLEHSDEDEIFKNTDCTKEELGWIQDDMKSLVRKYVLKEYLPERYKEK